MGFRLKAEEYFRGVIREPGGNAQFVVVSRGVRSACVKHTTKEAKKRNWDWIIELCRDDGNDIVTTLGYWSSLQGDLPPSTRREVPVLK